MLGLRSIRTATPALSQTFRQPIRQQVAKRWESSSNELHGTADNAFNRERQAVKEHAAATSGA